MKGYWTRTDQVWLEGVDLLGRVIQPSHGADLEGHEVGVVQAPVEDGREASTPSEPALAKKKPAS